MKVILLYVIVILVLIGVGIALLSSYFVASFATFVLAGLAIRDLLAVVQERD